MHFVAIGGALASIEIHANLVPFIRIHAQGCGGRRTIHQEATASPPGFAAASLNNPLDAAATPGITRKQPRQTTAPTCAERSRTPAVPEGGASERFEHGYELI